MKPALDEPIIEHAAYLRWFGRTSVIVAVAALFLAVVHPPEGLGLPICWLKASTGIPCPGCGLTRSLSATLRGDLSSAWKLHPFGPLLLPTFAGIAFVGLSPRRLQRAVAGWASRYQFVVNTTYGLFVTAFVLFGSARACSVLCACGTAIGAENIAAQRTNLDGFEAGEPGSSSTNVAAGSRSQRHRPPPAPMPCSGAFCTPL